MDMEKPSKKNRKKSESYTEAFFSRHVMRKREKYRDRPINRNRERGKKERDTFMESQRETHRRQVTVRYGEVETKTDLQREREARKKQKEAHIYENNV